jgi:hypothetical protein
VPTPHLTANKVTVGNTYWGNAMAFLTAGSVDLEVALPPQLTHRIAVHAVRFVAPGVRALQAAEPRVLLAGINFHNGAHAAAQRRDLRRVFRPLSRCSRR